MNADANRPEPDPLKSSPQPSPSATPDARSAASKSTAGGGSSNYGATDGRRGQAYSDLPTFDKPQVDPAPKPKPKSWLLPVVVALVLAAGLGGVALMHNGSGGDSGPPMVMTQTQNTLTLTGADLDQAATDRAMMQLTSGSPTPELAALPQDVQKEIMSGARKFYRIPPQSVDGSSFQSGDRISVDFNGNPYGTYDLSKPVTISLPLKIGDQIDVHVLSVAQGKTTLTVDLATVLNPVRCNPMGAGQSEQLLVQQGAQGTSYDWFEHEAASGNAVAQYGLGHMYQYGLGVQQDKSQAIHWYQQAAAQNYLDAKAQLQLLESNP